MRWLLPLLVPILLISMPVAARDVVTAATPSDIAVTVYRDPKRQKGDAMNAGWPQGFAMISEVRTVTLPAGVSTVRFEGVAEGMIAVSAIVTGLPGGTIEKNRNADLLSPAALVDGTLGNRVRITRTNLATGEAQSEQAIVRTRADGGLVLQTGDKYEAVRCSGLPETLSFADIPEGLSAGPVFTIDTHSDEGGTYQITLTYLAWGFDWEAHYVATLDKSGAQKMAGPREVGLTLVSWLTILNDNSQTFANAELLAVAGTINVESDFAGLSAPPTGQPLRLTCYPMGSTAAGSAIFQSKSLRGRVPAFSVGELPEPEQQGLLSRSEEYSLEDVTDVMVASEEQLGDLKLYRIPERVDVSAQGLKQVMFLNKENVRGEFIYLGRCSPYEHFGKPPYPAQLALKTVNDEPHGLGVAMPMGGFTLFEPSFAGDLLVNEQSLRDYAVGQDIEIGLGQSTNVFTQCAQMGDLNPNEQRKGWMQMQTKLVNANNYAITVRLMIGRAGEWQIRSGRNKPQLKDGEYVIELSVPANTIREFAWKIRRPASYF